MVVKFVQRCREEAHRLVAKKSLALQLYYYGMVGVLDEDLSYGHLRMVEYLDGETLDSLTHVPPNFRDRIQHALNVLHNQGYIFGDSWQLNIIITKNGDVKLINFDQAN